MNTKNQILDVLKQAKEYANNNYFEYAVNELQKAGDLLADSDKEEFANLGDDLWQELLSYIISDDTLIDLIKQNAEDFNILTIKNMLKDYNCNYDIHNVNDYGNIVDSELPEYLDNITDEYLESFKDLIK